MCFTYSHKAPNHQSVYDDQNDQEFFSPDRYETHVYTYRQCSDTLVFIISSQICHMHSQEKSYTENDIRSFNNTDQQDKVLHCYMFDFRVETSSLSHSAGFAHTEIHLVLQKSLTFMTIPTFHLLGYRLKFSDNKTSGLHFIKKYNCQQK